MNQDMSLICKPASKDSTSPIASEWPTIAFTPLPSVLPYSLPIVDPRPFSASVKDNSTFDSDPDPRTLKHSFELLLISDKPTPTDPWKCKLSKQQQVALFHLLNGKTMDVRIFDKPFEKKRILDSLYRLGLCYRRLTTYKIGLYGIKRAASYTPEYRRFLIRSIGW